MAGAEGVEYIPREDFRRSRNNVEDEAAAGDDGEQDEDKTIVEKAWEKVHELLPPQPIIGFSVEEDEEELSVFDSKLGGTPYFPKDMEYPCARSGDWQGEPLALLAQLNFEKLPHIPDFPTKGILQFFIAPDDCYGYNYKDCTRQDNFRVIYHETILTDETKLLSAEDLPDFRGSCLPFSGEYGLDAYEKMMMTNRQYREYQDAFVKCYNELADEPIDDFWDLDNKQLNELDMYDDINPDAWISGYPFFVQNDPRDVDESLSDCDVLLFELNSTEFGDPIVSWGDLGTGSFFIPRERLKKLDFSRVLYNQDCY